MIPPVGYPSKPKFLGCTKNLLKKGFNTLSTNSAWRHEAIPKIRVTLLSGRTIDQGTSKEYGKLSKEYQEKVAICEIDPDDLKELGLRENSNVKVSTQYGSVVVEAKDSKRAPHPKVVYMPYGLWVNLIVEPETHGTGMPSFKGIAAEVEPAPKEKVLTLPELLKQTFRKEP